MVGAPTSSEHFDEPLLGCTKPFRVAVTRRRNLHPIAYGESKEGCEIMKCLSCEETGNGADDEPLRLPKGFEPDAD